MIDLGRSHSEVDAACVVVGQELGGKSASVVFADTDLDSCVESSIWAVYDNAGQDCCARSRVLVERPAYKEFVERFEDVVLDLGERDVEPPQHLGSPSRDGDHVPAPVVRVRRPADESTGGQVVDGRDDVAAIDHRAPAEVGLTHRSVLVERRQDADVVPTHPGAAERVVQDLLGPSVGAAEQPGRLLADALRCRHPTQRTR